MQLTPNFRLMKPDGTDPVNVQDLNDNMDVLDAEVVKKLDKTGDASNVVNKFTQAGSRTNLLSGEKLSVSFGKIMKWFVDLKDVAFSGRYSDLTDRPTIPAGGIADKSKIIDNLDDIAANTQTGYMAGALAVKELNQNLDGAKIIHEGSGAATKYYAQLGADAASKKLLGNTPCYIKTWTGGNGGVQTINIPISDYPDYQQLSANNFKAGVTSLQGAMGQGWINGITDYNANTGVVTISYANHGSAALTGFLAISSAGFTDL